MGNNNSRVVQIPIDVSNCENWYRLALSLELCVKPALLEILHQPANGGLPRDEGLLHAALLQFKRRVTQGQEGIPRDLIKNDQWDVLCHVCTNSCPNACPRNGKTNSNDFDITLIVVLLSTKLPAPRGGWGGRNLRPNENSKAANAVRARQKRNKLSHTPMVHFANEQTFTANRNDIRSILQGLGVRDFSKFDSLETKVFDKQAQEAEKLLKEREKYIKEAKGLKNKKSLLQELSMLNARLVAIQMDVRAIKTTVESVETIVAGNTKTTLSFHLNLTKPLPFTHHQVKINGLLHRHMMADLKLFFKESCGDVSDSFKILITEIVPAEQCDKTSPNVKFLCEVKSNNISYLCEQLEDSLESLQAQKIIEKIESILPCSIKNQLQIETEVFVTKWKVGSLFVDIFLRKMDGSSWDAANITELRQYVNNVLQIHFNQYLTHATVVIHDVVQNATDMHQAAMFGTVTLRSKDMDNAIECVKKFDDSISQHIKKKPSADDPNICRKTYQFESSCAGIIIGAKHSTINRLREIPGIIDVTLDTWSYPTHCLLTVTGSTQDVVKKVHDLVIKKTDRGRFAKFSTTLIESKENEKLIVLKLCDESRKIPIVPHKEINKMYTLEHFKTAGVEESFQRLSFYSSVNRRKNDFQPFSVKRIEETFQQALDDIDISKVQTIDFNIIPGKVVFLTRVSEATDKILHRYEDGSLSVSAHKLKPVYITFLNPSFKEEIFDKLRKNSFAWNNKDAPEVYTKVHLKVGEKKVRFSVSLALDKNLDAVKEIDDSRLSDEKLRAIERVLKATTIGEVLQQQGEESWKVGYRRLSKLVHPDKNSHRGAKEAFQKLEDAKRKTIKKKGSSTPALVVETVKSVSSAALPKVLSIQKSKIKVCTITTFSQSTLDVRASFVTMETDSDGLSEHVRDVLNSCWENRDEHGGIQTPDGKTGISISCIKQITAGHVWDKEITTANGTTAVMEVTVKEIREKIEKSNEWKECLEIDMKLNYITEDREYKGMSAEDFTNDFLSIKEEWEKIRPVLC